MVPPWSWVPEALATRLVLDHVSLTVRPGEHAGIVGENGSGKSTLLRLIAGIELPDDGEVTVTADGSIGHLGQALGLPAGHTVQQAIDTALAELRAMECRMRELEADLTEDRLAEYGDVPYEARGGYEVETHTDKALHGLGLAHIGRDRLLGSLSGGEQARLGLACLLAASPEVLLLDEPGNHLDAASRRAHPRLPRPHAARPLHRHAARDARRPSYLKRKNCACPATPLSP
jgi:macrolide transport system ATP-binding/permease protein